MIESSFRKKKSLGQNFLKSKSAIKTMVRSANIVPGETILEIGPGKGVLTEELLKAGAVVIAVEKDDRLIPELEARFHEDILQKKLLLIHGDILLLTIDEILGTTPYKVVANIPYYITGILFQKLLEHSRQPTHIVVLIQKEVAKRIVAQDKKESILSLSIKAYGTPKYVEKVSRKMFSPEPNVDSAILSISHITKDFFDSFSEETFFTWIRAGFAQKRKKLIRNLESIADKKHLGNAFSKLMIDTNTRAEDLSLSDWKKIISN